MFDEDEEVFDKFLRDGGIELAHEWCLKTLARQPWSKTLKDMAAFSTTLLQRRGVLVSNPELLLLGRTDGEWAKAAAFLAVKKFTRDLAPYFLEGNERLRFIWVYRFNVLEEVRASQLLCRLIMTYGCEEDRRMIREDLFTQYPPDDVM